LLPVPSFDLAVGAVPDGNNTPVAHSVADNRKDYYAADEVQRKAAESVVLVVGSAENTNALKNGEKKFEDLLKGETMLKNRIILCPGERFTDQRSLWKSKMSFCSGFLVADDVVATSAHCITGSASDYFFAFGYHLEKEGEDLAIKQFDRKNIYYGQNIVGLSKDFQWALVQLTEKVTNHKPADVSNKSDQIK